MQRATPPTPAEPRTDHAELSPRGLLRHLLGDLAHADGATFHGFATLFRRPGALTRDYISGPERGQVPPLRLYLIANFLFFLIGPALGLLAYRLDAFLASGVYREVVAGEVARGSQPLPVYRAYFDASLEYRQPAFVFVLVPLFAMLLWGLHRRRCYAEHLAFSLHFFAWLLLAGPAYALLVRLGYAGLTAAGGLPSGKGEQAVVALAFALVAAFLLGLLWHLGAAVRRVYGTGRVRAAAEALALAGGLFVLLGLYAHLLFWITLASLRFGA